MFSGYTPGFALLSWLVRCPTFSLDTRHSSPTGPAPACALSSPLFLSEQDKTQRSLYPSLFLSPLSLSLFTRVPLLLSLSLISLPVRFMSCLISSRLVSFLVSLRTSSPASPSNLSSRDSRVTHRSHPEKRAHANAQARLRFIACRLHLPYFYLYRVIPKSRFR